jgi:hypothetical protein
MSISGNFLFFLIFEKKESIYVIFFPSHESGDTLLTGGEAIA